MSGRNAKRHIVKSPSIQRKLLSNQLRLIRVTPLPLPEPDSEDADNDLQHKKGEKTHPLNRETKQSQQINRDEQSSEVDKRKVLLQKFTKTEKEDIEISRRGRQCCPGETCLLRVLLGLAFALSIGNLLLTFLLTAKNKNCVCQEERPGWFQETVEGPRNDRVSSDEPSVNDPPPDVQLLDDKIEQLRGNISHMKAMLVMLQQDVSHTKSEISTTKQMIYSTRNNLSMLQEETQDSLFETQTNISRQLGDAVSKTNDSFHSKLASVKTVFMSKLNNTEKNLLDADDSLWNILDTINSSLSAQIQSINKLQGPTGPPGFNGSQGDQGPTGSQGPQGDTGDQGNQGPSGDPGQPGRNGTVGPTGDKGDAGPKGSKGEQGDQGGDGAQGPTGAQGPQGAGNFSACQYHEDFSQASAGPGAFTDIPKDEPQNMRFLGVTCSTGGFAEYNLIVSQEASGLRFKCECRGQSLLFTTVPSRCYIHYWQCPLTT